MTTNTKNEVKEFKFERGENIRRHVLNLKNTPVLIAFVERRESRDRVVWPNRLPFVGNRVPKSLRK